MERKTLLVHVFMCCLLFPVEKSKTKRNWPAFSTSTLLGWKKRAV